MRLSRYLLATLREAPKEAEIASHRWLVRAGMIRQLAAGIYDLLPTGLRALRRVEAIVREEMDAAGALEVQLPVVQPAELWRESGRWEVYGKELLRFQDRHGRDFVLGPTHEEVITDLVRRTVNSYRQLPLNLYQIHTKFRDEIRPRFGLMRAREFTMKDAYSFHADEASLQETYERMIVAYRRIFERCGLAFRDVEADTGAIGGSASREFMVLAETGEDEVVHCDCCDYAANRELATFRRETPAGFAPRNDLPAPEEVATPGQRTIEEVAAFLGVPAERLLKSILFETDRGWVLAVVRGDLELSEAKVRNAVGAAWIALPESERVREELGLVTGYLGPVDLPEGVRIVADHSVAGIHDGVTGANREDAHLLHVEPGRDFTAELADLAAAEAGLACPRCAEGRLAIQRGIEVGHVFQLGTKYSEAMGATFLDAQGRERPFVMGCYGIGIGRTVAAAIEQNHDERGIVWPAALAPFTVAVVPLDMRNPELLAQAEAIYADLIAAGVDAYLDDRDERAGVKLTDAEILGVPLRVVLGRKGFAAGVAEVTERRSLATTEVPLADLDEHLRTRLAELTAACEPRTPLPPPRA